MNEDRHQGDTRAFSQLSRAWYGPSLLERMDRPDEVVIGFYAPDGGTSGEFTIRWIVVGGKPTPCLEAFDDSWSALWEFKDVLAAMASHDDENMTPDEFCALLVSLGIPDRTPVERS